MNRTFAVGLAASCVALAALSGCSGGGKRAADGKSLYERLGGEAAIAAVSSDFVDRVAANPKVNVTRTGAPKQWDPTPENVALLKKRVTQFVCMATGGPQRYEGKDMKTVHAGMMISREEFAAAGADLVASLDKFKVPKREQDELMAIVATTQNDIVEVK